MNVEEVKTHFPTELEMLLDFTETESHVVVKGKNFLKTPDFRKTSDIVKQLGGEYVSAGKDSHFKVPKEAQVSEKVRLANALEVAIGDLQRIEAELRR